LPVINREKKRADKEYLWMARAVKEKLLFFDYREGSRSAKVVREIFKGFKGTLQTDGYCAYEIFEEDPSVMLINCWAHCRRNYESSLVENKTLAQYALGKIQLLYKLERVIKDKKYSPVRTEAERQRLALPIIKDLEKWIEQNYKTVLPKSRIGKAMSYNYSRIQGLSRYIYDGNLQIDNNPAENAIRPVTVSRKNFLFCGNHNAASNAAMIFTLTGCCREHNINTRHYLIDVLNQLPYILDKKESLKSLMPDKWIEQHPESLLCPDSSKMD
jgi:transposase